LGPGPGPKIIKLRFETGVLIKIYDLGHSFHAHTLFYSSRVYQVYLI
jgi:hypothetical protein